MEISVDTGRGAFVDEAIARVMLGLWLGRKASAVEPLEVGTTNS